MRQYKFDKMAKFMKIKSINPKIKQSAIAKELAISTSTLQRHKREINKFSPYRIPPSITQENKSKRLRTILSMTSKRPQMISN